MIFRDVNEVTRTSGHTKPFERTTGWRKAGLAMLGYNDKGEKNLWGKINPMSYAAPGLQQAYAEGFSTGDTNKVLKENRSEAVGAQLASLSLASNFIPGVGIAGKMGISAGLGVAKGINNGSNQEATNAVTNAAGTALVQKTLNEVAKDKAKASLDESILNADEDLLNESDYSTASDSVVGDGAEDVLGNTPIDESTYTVAGGDSAIANGGKAMKGAKFASGALTALNVAGDVAEVVQTQMSYNKGLKNSSKKIMKNSVISPGAQNYL